jgi:hypothetical protein
MFQRLGCPVDSGLEKKYNRSATGGKIMRIVGLLLVVIGLAAFAVLIALGSEETVNRQMMMLLNAASVAGGPSFIGGCVLLAGGAIVSALRREENWG